MIPYREATGEEKVEFFTRFKDAFLFKTRDEWFDVLVKVGVPPTPVFTLEEAVGNHDILDRRMLLDLDHLKLGTVRQLGATH